MRKSGRNRAGYTLTESIKHWSQIGNKSNRHLS